MKLYVIHIYPPDDYEIDDTFFGVFDSKEKYQKALQTYGAEIDFEFEDGTYDVYETKLNKIYE